MSEPLSLAERRLLVQARLRKAELDRTIDLLHQATEVERVAQEIEASKRSHPSRGRPYDREEEK